MAGPGGRAEQEAADRNSRPVVHVPARRHAHALLVCSLRRYWLKVQTSGWEICWPCTDALAAAGNDATMV